MKHVTCSIDVASSMYQVINQLNNYLRHDTCNISATCSMQHETYQLHPSNKIM